MFKAIAITSSIPVSFDDSVDKIAYVVEKLRFELPNIPIGVEPCVATREHVHILKDAGATEIKLNVQTWDADVLKKICPGWELDIIIARLADAVEIFGRGKVCSNIIAGLPLCAISCLGSLFSNKLY